MPPETDADFLSPRDSLPALPEEGAWAEPGRKAAVARAASRRAFLADLGADSEQWERAGSEQLKAWALAAAQKKRPGQKAAPEAYFGRLADWFSSRAPAFVSNAHPSNVIELHPQLNHEGFWQQSWWLGRWAQGESWARLWAEAFLANCAGGMRSGSQLIAAAEFAKEGDLARVALESSQSHKEAFEDLAALFGSAKSQWRPPAIEELRNWRQADTRGPGQEGVVQSASRARFARLADISEWAAGHARWVDLCLDWENIPEEDPSRHGDVCGQALRLWNEAGARLPQDLRSRLPRLAQDALARSTKGHAALWSQAVNDPQAWKTAMAGESAAQLIHGFAPAREATSLEKRIQREAGERARQEILDGDELDGDDEDDEGRLPREPDEQLLALAEREAQQARADMEAKRQQRLRAVERSPGVWSKLASSAWTGAPEKLAEAIEASGGVLWKGADELLRRPLSLKTLNTVWPAMFFALSQAEALGVNPSGLLSEEAWRGLWMAHIERKSAPSIAGQWAMSHWAPQFEELKARGFARVDPQRWAEFEGRVLRQELAGALRGSVEAAAQEAGLQKDDDGDNEEQKTASAPKARSRRL